MMVPIPPSMAPVRKQLDPKFSHPSSFRSLEEAHSCITELSIITSRNNIQEVIEGLLVCGLPAVALFLSSVESHHSAWLLDLFPSKPHLYSSSVFPVLLPLVGDLLCFNDFDDVDRKDMVETRRIIKNAPEQFATFLSLDFPNAEGDGNLQAPEQEFGVKLTQRQRKLAKKKAQRTVVLDPKVFEDWHLPVPTSKMDAEDTANTVLEELKGIWADYLHICAMPSFQQALRPIIYPTVPGANAKHPSPAHKFLSSTNQEGQIVQRSEPPPAIPKVQPLKSALQFENVEGFGNWRVLISGRADGDLREARKKDRESFRIIMKKIRELSRGHFSEDNQKRLTGAGPEVPIFEAKMTRDSRLVYQIDCISDIDRDVSPTSSSNTYPLNFIRVFGIYTHAQLAHSRFWDSLARHIGKKGKEYRDRCVYRLPQASKRDRVYDPASFPPREETDIITYDPLDLPKEDLDELHSLMILGKFITFSRPVWNSIIADLDTTFPFDLSPREMKIIECPASCYVLGRSGTGKTTTMLFKMVCVEASYDVMKATTRKPRQLFVTHSRVLATKVAEYFSKLTASLNLASRSLQELKLHKDSVHPDIGMIDTEEEAAEVDLPPLFSQLEEHHFPLFITYTQLCTMLEADYTEKGFFTKRSGSFVTYDRFLKEYWAHFPQTLTKRLDPALVFSEILGIIKGSEKTLTCPEWFLDHSAYKALGHRAFSTFADNRATVYEIFLAYTKQKRTNGDFDAADRSHGILQAIRDYDVPGSKIDYLYVDEVQDNLLIDALVLRSICSNPNGLFWAGDTAQTISVGSSFKFNELKALLYRIEKKRVKDSRLDPDKPASFQLAVNYRSHGGIVNCAHSVVQLIMRFWPDAIDALQPEHGVIDGPKPVFFNGWDRDTMRYEQFLFGSSGQSIEFGAQQCILVRDESAKMRLRGQVGDIGIIMTIYESKGLEFNDVLLYDFFEDSAVELSRWRVVLNALDDQPAPDVEARHVSVCAELKSLYVSITRARKNVWIADCSDKGEPLRVYWTSNSLIQNCTPEDVPRLAVKSTKTEWANQGRSLFDNRRYYQAKHCYTRAEMPREAAVADAYFLRDQARKAPSHSAIKSEILAFETAYRLAAERFQGCALDPPNPKNRRQYFLNAADCFEIGGDYFRAAECYAHVEEFTKSCRLYRKAGKFVQAVDTIKAHKEEMDTDVAETIMDVARLFYFTKHDLNCVLGNRSCRQSDSDEHCEHFGKAGDLFSSAEEGLEYLEDRDLDVARATLMASIPGKLSEAAEIHLAEGRSLDAIRLFLQDERSGTAMRRAFESLREGLWRHMSFGVSVNEPNEERDTLLGFAASIDDSVLVLGEKLEISMFQTIFRHSTTRSSTSARELLDLSLKLSADKRPAAALLCLDHYFAQGSFTFDGLNAAGVAEILSHFIRYSETLREVALIREPCRSQTVRTLFGIKISNENVLHIPRDTYLGTFVLSGRIRVLQPTEDGYLISDSILSTAFREALCQRLASRIREEEARCRGLAVFSPCLSFAISNECRRHNCTDEHRSADMFTKETYNQRLRIHLLQIYICNFLDDVENPKRNLTALKGFWINRLYEAFNPPYQLLGTICAIDRARIPNVDRLFAVARVWVRFLVYSLRHRDPPDPPFISNLMRNIELACILDRYQADSYIFRTPCLDAIERLPPDFVRYKYGRKPWSLYAGSIFLKTIIEKRFYVNLSVLCDFVESLCAAFVIHNAYERRRTLHGVVLPRSLIAKTLQVKIWEQEPKHCVPFNIYTDSVISLLEPLFAGANRYIWHHPGNRNIFIARICRSLCLFGYNISVERLRQQILRGITALRKDGRQFPWLYAHYVNATSWDGLARAFRQSISTSPMDEMVKLVHAKENPGHIFSSIRNIPYANEDELWKLLEHTRLYPASALSAAAVPFMPSKAAVANLSARNAGPVPVPQSTVLETQRPLVTVIGDPHNDDPSPPAPTEADQTIPASNLSTSGPSPQVSAPQDQDDANIDNDLATEETDNDPLEEMPEEQYVVDTLEETKAAKIIQAACRNWFNRRRKVTRDDGSNAALRHFYRASLEVAQKKEWNSTLHRKMFLGPLVHIRLFLEGLHTHVRFHKERTKIRLHIAQHEELDSLGPRLTLINTTFRAVQRLQKALDPKNALQDNASIEGIKTAVAECQTIVEKAATLNIPARVKDDLDIGVKGILKVAPPKKRKQKKVKPDLVMDDDDYYDDGFSASDSGSEVEGYTSDSQTHSSPKSSRISGEI
ncbi:UvrD-like helicase ATP-binding domain-containing protein [Pleurotus pulmonarius]